MRLIVALILLCILPSIAVGQSADETPDQRASLVQGSIRAAQTYLERVAADLVRGDTAQARRDLNQLRGRLRATETNVLVLRVIVRSLDLPPDSLPPIVVIPPDPPPPVVVPPVPTEKWDSTLTGAYAGDVVVPDGKRWLVGKNVTIAGNLRTDGGLIGMRPGSSLTFIGANPLNYVGGGMGYAPEFANDRGLWVGGTGILDIAGSPKTGWTRAACHSSWSCGTDEIYISPTAPGDFTPRRWTPGQDSVPQFDPRVPPAEIINVTRDITIEGPGHIHISSTERQRLEYFTLRNMGIINPVCGTVCGRYALHLHMMGEASQGTVIRGVAAVDSKGTVFAIHSSHGVTLQDVVCVNSYAECFWSDKGDRTDGARIEGLASSGTFAPREITGATPRNAAVVLGCGSGNSISNSAVSGVIGSDEYAAGYEWFPCNRDGEDAVWEFSEGLTAHNLEGPCSRFWTNSGQPHTVANLRCYNGAYAILNGAYSNALQYVDVFSVGGGGIFHNTSCNTRLGDNAPGRYLRPEIHASTGPALRVKGQNLAAECRWIFEDCEALEAGPGAPKVQIDATSHDNPWLADFLNCGVTAADFRCAADAVPTTSVWISGEGEFTCRAGRFQLVQSRERPMTIPAH